MKKILSVIIMLSVFLTSCLKDDTINTEGGLISTPTVVQFTYSGLEYFNNGALITAGQTDPMENLMIINLAARSTLATDLTVTVGADDAKRVSYNATSDVKFEAMPDSCYTIPIKEGAIKAGEYLDTLVVVFYPEKINPTKNYMLPVSIKDAQGQTIASNFSTYYYYTIGNPIAGAYVDHYLRWNNGTGTGATSADYHFDAVGVPVTPERISLQSGYGDQNGVAYHYLLSFTDNAGVLTNFSVVMDPTDVAAFSSSSGISLITPASIISADPVTGIYKFTFQVTNSAGAPRTFTDTYTKQ